MELSCCEVSPPGLDTGSLFVGRGAFSFLLVLAFGKQIHDHQDSEATN
jgi:hypothetical protein